MELDHHVRLQCRAQVRHPLQEQTPLPILRGDDEGSAGMTFAKIVCDGAGFENRSVRCLQDRHPTMRRNPGKVRVEIVGQDLDPPHLVFDLEVGEKRVDTHGVGGRPGKEAVGHSLIRNMAVSARKLF